MTTSDASIHEQIVASVTQRLHWSSADVVVQPSDLLSTRECKVFRASNRSTPDAGVVHFLLTGDGLLLDPEQRDADLSGALRRCSGSADAAWWAQAVSAFHGDAAGRVILPEDKLSISLVESAGGTYAPPQLVDAGAGKQLKYYVLRHAIQPALVEASLPETGALGVVVTPVR